MKYYSIDKILTKDCDYNIIIGERSNGKTTACLMYALDRYLETGEQFAYIRRNDIDIRGNRATSLFNGLTAMGYIEKKTKGEYDTVRYWRGQFILTHSDEKVRKHLTEHIIGNAFALSMMYHDKGVSFPNITTIIFDEFMTRGQYLHDEFNLFMNTLSTIIRLRDNVKVFMLANTVSKYSPYFVHMGLTHINQLKQGEIVVYDSDYKYGLKVALEYCETSNKCKPSNKFFGFNNQKSEMITSGGWETGHYPRVTERLTSDDYVYTFHIIFNDYHLQCNYISSDTDMYIFVHRETTPPKDDELIFTDAPNVTERWSNQNVYFRRNILKPLTEIENFMKKLIVSGKVVFTDDDIGDAFYNYIKWCKTETPIQ